jgi:hypothetical protein
MLDALDEETEMLHHNAVGRLGRLPLASRPPRRRRACGGISKVIRNTGLPVSDAA